MKQRRQKKHSKKIFIGSTLVLFLLGGSVFTGCSDSGKPTVVQAPIAVNPKQQVLSQGSVTVVTEKPKDEYSYNPVGKRDPFAPLIVKEERKAQSGERPPLERYNLYEFKLTGVVWGGLGYSAMLEGPDGKGYFVHVGTIMGQNKGVVKKITQNTMVIEEKFKNISGEIDRKEVVIELRKKEEGMQ